MNFEEILNIAKARRTAKQYNPNLDIDQEKIDKLYEFVNTAPSSMGLELVRFLHLKRNSDYKKELILHLSNSNIEKAMMASDVVLFVTKTNEFYNKDNEQLIETVKRNVKFNLEGTGQEYKEGSEEYMLNLVANMQNPNIANNEEWTSRQAYIQLAYMLYGAKALGIDSTTMEGFNISINEYLRDNNLIKEDERVTLVVALGYTEDIDNAFIGKKQLRRSVKDLVKYV